MNTSEWLAVEERKRNRNLSSSERYRLDMEALNWAEKQIQPPRNSPAACRAKEDHLLRGNAECLDCVLQ